MLVTTQLPIQTQIFYSCFDVHLWPPTLKILSPPMRRLPVKQMFRTWMKTLLHCGQGRNQLFISGGQFSWTFIRWRHRVYWTVIQLFRKRSQIKFSSQHFRKWELFSFIQVSNYGGAKGKRPLKICSPLLEKCVGHSLKIWAPPTKFFVPSGVPNWLRAWF